MKKNILIIKAHPSSKNLTHGMADIYKSEKEAQGSTVKIVDTSGKNVDKIFESVKKMAEK